MRVEDKNLNEIRFRSDVYKMLSEPGKSAPYASLIPYSTISASESLKRRLHFYHPEADGGISILDDTLGIDWKIPTEHANLSEKDTKHAMLKDFDSPFDINVDLYK